MPRKPKPPPKRHERTWGAGTVTETRPGRYRAFRARQHHADGTSSRPSRTFADRQQAEAWARGDVEPAVILLGHWLDRWLALRLPTVRPHTKRNYRRAVDQCRPLAGVPLADVSTEQLQAHTNGLLRTQARSSVAVWRSTISSALGAAVPRFLQHNPMLGVRLPRETEWPAQAWRADEVAQLIAAASGRAHEVWLWVSLGTGLRLSESRALTWPDIDMAALTMRVDKALNAITGEIGPTKSGRSRIIDLPEELVPVLVAHRARQRPQERRVCTSGYSGRVPAPSTLRTWLAKLCATAGVTAFPLHSTRRTYGTLALEAGTPLKEVSEALGHASVAVTAKAYSQIVNQRQRRAANAIGAVLVPKTGPIQEVGANIGSRDAADQM